MASECSECAGGYIWGTHADYLDTCVEVCAEGQFFDYTVTDLCVDCVTDCLVCDNDSTCITCDITSSNHLLLTEGICGGDCGDVTGLENYWIESSDNSCVLCTQAECATCEDASACTSCVVGYHLEIDPTYGTPGVCVSDCGDYQWESYPDGETEGGECENCMTDCI